MKERPPPLGFFGWTVSWTIGLLVPTILYYLMSTAVHDGPWTPGLFWGQVPGWIGLFLPFAAFAGGVAVHAYLPPVRVLARALAVAVVSYGLSAYLHPVSTYHAQKHTGGEVSSQHPFGPETPRALIANRLAVEADPPARYTFRVDDPLSTPPNWLTYLLHTSAVMAFFSVFSALLGHLAAGMTTGLSPPNRLNARWAIGLFVGLVFFVAETAGGRWVRADPGHPGVVGAWLPLAVPLVCTGVFHILASRRRQYAPDELGPSV